MPFCPCCRPLPSADFEEACEELDIPLHVLRPRRPQWNGCVERTNRSARAEFWSLHDGPLTVEHVALRLSYDEFFFNAPTGAGDQMR